ncbi:hypothetical protein ACTXT7_009542 [Hymenolepis weldensis]
MNSFASLLSRKLFLYFLGLRLATSTIGSLVVSGCGLLAGLLYRYTFIQRINLIPSPVARVFSRILSQIFASGESKDDQTPIGATLEIQRQEALDRRDRMLMDLRRSQVMNSMHGNDIRLPNRNYPPRNVIRQGNRSITRQIAKFRSKSCFTTNCSYDNRILESLSLKVNKLLKSISRNAGVEGRYPGAALIKNSQSSHRRRSYVPEPQDVRLLSEMGFSEERVRQALVATHGDLNDAINLLRSSAFFQQ